MNDNKPKNSGSITTQKRPKQNMKDPTPTAVSSEIQVHLNQYTSSTFTNKNEQSLNESTVFSILTITIELSCDIGDYLERDSQIDHVKARFLELSYVPNDNCHYPFRVIRSLSIFNIIPPPTHGQGLRRRPRMKRYEKKESKNINLANNI